MHTFYRYRFSAAYRATQPGGSESWTICSKKPLNHGFGDGRTAAALQLEVTRARAESIEAARRLPDSVWA